MILVTFVPSCQMALFTDHWIKQIMFLPSEHPHFVFWQLPLIKRLCDGGGGGGGSGWGWKGNGVIRVILTRNLEN